MPTTTTITTNTAMHWSVFDASECQPAINGHAVQPTESEGVRATAPQHPAEAPADPRAQLKQAMQPIIRSVLDTIRTWRTGQIDEDRAGEPFLALLQLPHPDGVDGPAVLDECVKEAADSMPHDQVMELRAGIAFAPKESILGMMAQPLLAKLDGLVRVHES
ncbi:MAG TPA: hypothetical protein VHA82_06725 [Ramlibacter sp.]|uniref:hypothetical protein n=1 Tax=Ramlibacter sp. TaxID=1917967 RepID=UPI002BCD1E25|nr:hypothetical protein [Ramlibacter sp.]HVZ43486.1 hypothetical protein [Ramlibacter sp.]